MNFSNKRFTFLENWFFQYAATPMAVMVFIALGWYTVCHQAKALTETSVAAYQQTELEIVRSAARSVELYISHEFEARRRTDVAEFEQEIFGKFIAPIHLLENGDAWIYAPDHVVFDLSEDFPDEYFGKSMAEIFEMQEVNGASHFDEMVADITEAREGVGWYVWLPEKGKEIAAWTPARAGEYVWVIGLSTPLSEILESTGAAGEIQMVFIRMWGTTILMLGVLLLWGIGAMRRWQIKEALATDRAQLLSIFDSIDEVIYVADPESYEVLYVNQTVKDAFQKELIGGICYKEFQGFDSPCEFCTNEIILKEKPAPYRWQYHNPVLNRDYDIVDRIIKWPDGRDVRFEFAQDITKRMQMENEFRKLHQAVEQSANMVVITDPDGVIEYVNPKFVEVTGYSMEETLGKNPSILKSGRHSDAHYQELWQLIISGREWHGEFCNKRKDGSIYWEQASIAPVFNAVGKITNFIAVKEDITQQINIERALQKAYTDLEAQVAERTAELKKSEERYRLLADNSSDFVWVADLETRLLTYVSPSVEQLLGFTPQEALSRPFDERMNPDSMKLIWQALEDEFAKNIKGENLERTRVIEVEMAHKEGRSVWMETTVRFLYDDEGKINSLMGAARDITERKKAAQALRRYKQIISATNDHMSFINRDYVYRAVNEAYLKAHKKARQKIVGHTVAELLGNDLFETEIKKRLDRCLAGERVRYQKWLNFPGAGQRYMDVSYHPFSDVYGKITGIVVSSHDITERKEMEEKLRQQATTDPLTKIFNRRHFFELAQQELERSQRYSRPLSIIIFDIDFFKKVNDTYGHGAGDEVLRKLTKECQDSLRENDVFARYGGEEFVILLPETDLEQARQMAERMRKGCAETPLDVGSATVNLTVSFGVSSLGNETLPLDELLLRADKALYASKEAGRNRVTVWGEEKQKRIS